MLNPNFPNLHDWLNPNAEKTSHDSTHCRRRNQPSATHTFLQVVQGLCVDAPETTCDQQTFEPPLFDMILLASKIPKHMMDVKNFFLNTLGNFNFARAQKKSTPCKTQCKMSIRTALERF
jgi:hypothetical protein